MVLEAWAADLMDNLAEAKGALPAVVLLGSEAVAEDSVEGVALAVVVAVEEAVDSAAAVVLASKVGVGRSRARNSATAGAGSSKFAGKLLSHCRIQP